jgi:hypothetical protein
MIMNLINKLKTIFMARIEHKKFAPLPNEIAEGATPMSKLEVIESLSKYKLQNPVKYEQKKEALFARYGLTLEEEKETVPDANDLELEALKVKAKK